MAKTCRTCRQSRAILRCTVHHSYVHPKEIFDCHKPRETPLLVDALAKVCQVALTHLSGEATKFSEREPIAVRDQLRKALLRYQEEVGDAEVC